MNRKMRGASAIVGLMLAGASLAACADRDSDSSEDASFDGDTITVVINYSAGGPTDTFGRLFVEHLSEHIDGNPNFVVKNVDGAEGVLGSNEVFNAKPDGRTIGILTAPGLPQVLDNEAVQFDMAEWTWLSGIAETEAFFVRSELNIASAGDLATTDEELVIGGYGPTDVVDLSLRSALNSLGIDYTYVTGYPGGNDALAAFEKDEINAFILSLSSYIPRVMPMIESGDAAGIAQIGLLDGEGNVVRDERVADLPTLLEVLEANGEVSPAQRQAAEVLSADLSLLRAIVAPPGVNENVADELRTAVQETLESSKFQDEARKLLGFDLSPVSPEDALSIAQGLDSDDKADGVEFLKALAADPDKRD